MPAGTELEAPPEPIPHHIDGLQSGPTNTLSRDPRPSNKNPNFVRDYFQSSRLHFIGSFRARYEAMMVAVGSRLNVHPSVLLRPPPKRKSASDRVIVHIDMDCFFASIAVTKKPELRGKCIAICHGGGEISSCSYEARAFGVRAGMFYKDARKFCPQLLNVDYDFQTYEKVCIQIYSFFYDYPGVSVEAVSVDEAYLDITDIIGKDDSQSSAEALVSHLRNRIQMETGCTASAGIGPSKLVARLATKGAKPNGQLRVRQEDVIKYLDTLSIKDLPGIGWRTGKKFAARNVTTVPQLRAISLINLQQEFGERQGQVFHDLARALDSRPVEPLKPRKSIGAEASWGIRFENDETDKVIKFILDIADVVASRVTAAGAYGKKMTYKAYRKIPDSSMHGWKHLGHGPCTTLTKSAKLSTNCGVDGFKSSLREKCLEIHNKWKIRHDEFRGVGVQVTDLVFADLSFNQSALPVNRTRRIDTFFSAAIAKENPSVQESRVITQGRTQAVQLVENATEEAGPICNNDIHVQSSDGLGVKESSSRTDFVAASGKIEKEKVETLPEAESQEHKQLTKQISTGKVLTASDLPDGWDRQVFEALPEELQAELIQEGSRVPTQVNPVDTSNHERDAAEADQRDQTRLPKRTREAMVKRQEVRQVEKKPRRKQAAQITMTQCADISELRKIGHEVLDAEEFREKPFRDVVELLDDLKPRRRTVRLQGATRPSEESGRAGKDTEKPNDESSNPKTDFEIPSPPSLSSDSESSYGVSGAVNKEGFEHSRIYADEELTNYASALKAWMQSNAHDIKTGHIELLRGRVLEFLHMKELDRACTELRTIRKYAEEVGGAAGAWKLAFNDLLLEVQNESLKLHGFTLRVRPLPTVIRTSHQELNVSI